MSALKKAAGMLRSSLFSLLLLLLCVITISSFAGVDPIKSLLGNYWRNDGLITLAHLVAFAFLVGLLWTKTFGNKVLQAIAIGAIVNCFVALGQAFAFSLLGWTDLNDWGIAFGATFSQPVFLAGYLATTLPLVGHYFLQRSKRLAITICTLLIITIAITQTWGALLAGSIGLLLVTCQNQKKRKTIVVIITIVLISTTVLGTLHTLKNARLEADNRVRIGISLLQAGSSHPMLGWGWANIDHAFASTNWPFHREEDIYLDKAHSHLLEFFVTTGIPGLMLYVGLLFKMFRTLHLAKHKHLIENQVFYSAVIASLTSYLIFTQTNITSIATEMIFWCIFGFATIHTMQKIVFQPR
ncbi:O-antigen ligase family protein [Candidatus Woesebacteria bacterium]|nr:O-antigen ligase family protein [Candidatus Woesebacteria bacterium]